MRLKCMALNSYTAALNDPDVEKLRQLLHERGFEFSEKQYAHYNAKKGKLNVTVSMKVVKETSLVRWSLLGSMWINRALEA